MECKIKILFVDDDVSLGQIVTLAVEAAGYEVHYQTSLSGIVESVKEWHPQLIVLDVEIGGKSGIEAASGLHRLFPSVPILFVSSHTDMESVVKGLEAGGVTYLKKPFEIDELLAYIRRYTRPLPAEESVRFGSFRLEADRLYYGEALFKKLTFLESKLLTLLLAHRGEIVSRHSIIQELWGKDCTSTAEQSLNNLIFHLRKYLSEDKTVQLVTHSKQGYSLIL